MQFLLSSVANHDYTCSRIMHRRSFSRSLHHAYHTFCSIPRQECPWRRLRVLIFVTHIISLSFCSHHLFVFPLDSAGDEGIASCHYKLVSHHVNRVELSIISSKGKRINYPSSSNTLSTVFSKTNVIVPPCTSAIGRTFTSAHNRSKSTADKRLSDVDLGTSRSSGSKS